MTVTSSNNFRTMYNVALCKPVGLIPDNKQIGGTNPTVEMTSSGKWIVEKVSMDRDRNISHYFLSLGKWIFNQFIIIVYTCHLETHFAHVVWSPSSIAVDISVNWERSQTAYLGRIATGDKYMLEVRWNSRENGYFIWVCGCEERRLPRLTNWQGNAPGLLL